MATTGATGEMDYDDLFGGVIDLEMKMYQEGYETGETTAIETSKEKSLLEGKGYGQTIGNHVGYYVTILNLFKQRMPEKFQSNQRLQMLCKKLEKKLGAVKIQDCYEDFFEKDQATIKTIFLQILSIVKVKSTSDDVKKDIEF